MGHKEHILRQTIILEHLVQILDRRPNVLGVSIGGSYAKGCNDAFSDLDIDCYIDSKSGEDQMDIIDEIDIKADLLSRFRSNDSLEILLFANGVSVELNTHPLSEVTKNDIFYAKILYDPNGLLIDGFSKIPQPYNPRSTICINNDSGVLDWYLIMFRQVYCLTRRAMGKDDKAVQKRSAAVNTLLQIKHNSLELLSDGTNLSTVERLNNIVPEHNPEATVSVVFSLLHEFEDIYITRIASDAERYSQEKLDNLRTILVEYEAIEN